MKLQQKEYNKKLKKINLEGSITAVLILLRNKNNDGDSMKIVEAFKYRFLEFVKQIIGDDDCRKYVVIECIVIR